MNRRDSPGATPLKWAARSRHEEVVLLQQKHAQPDVPDMRNGGTTHPQAAGSGHERVIRQFPVLFADLGRVCYLER